MEKKKTEGLASMSSNSTMPALGVTMADWIGKSCIDGIFSWEVRDVTTRTSYHIFFQENQKEKKPSRYVNNIGKVVV